MKQKLSKCKVCRHPYAKRSMSHKACSPDCALILVEKEKERNRKRDEARIRKEHREQKIALKPLQYWLKRAQLAVNNYVRARDEKAGYGCITCGTHDAQEYHAGHWISVGASSATRFDDKNINRQCIQCNVFGGGMAQEYEARLPARIGQAEVERLKHSIRSKKWTREECQAIEIEYKTKLKELMNEPTRKKSD